VRAGEWLDRWIIGAGAALLCLGSFGLSWKLNFREYTNDDEPYVYVQTKTDVNQLFFPLRRLVERDPVNYQLRGHFILGEQYPFTWVLGDFPRVDYPDMDNLPDPLDADFLLVDDAHVEKIEPLLRLPYFKIPMHIRGNSDSSATLYLYTQTFAGLVPADTAKFEPGGTEEAK